MKIRVRLSRALLWLLVLSFVSTIAARPSIASPSPDHPPDYPHATVRLPGHVLPRAIEGNGRTIEFPKMRMRRSR